MGLCASVGRNSSSAVELDMAFVPSNTNENLVPPTPTKKKPDSTLDPPVNSIGFMSQVSSMNHANSYRSNGSKEDTFFDTQAWLDSDCDDDFLSVRGDFTPSRGSTPVHCSLSGSPKYNKVLCFQSNGALSDSKPLPLRTETMPSHSIEPQNTSSTADTPQGGISNPDSTLSSPSDKKRKLMDLFRESRVEGDSEGQSAALERKTGIPKSADGTPYISGVIDSVSTGGRTPNPNGDSVNQGKEKPQKSALSCFPRLIRSWSVFNEKKSATGTGTGSPTSAVA
ncbi:hypothetical protein Dimus_013209 [Dionaea muscipula]